MRNILFGACLCLIIVFCVQYCSFKKDTQEQITESTSLIEEQLKNVGKLIVTEGHYAQVFTYEDTKKYLGDLYTAEKKALVTVNAQAVITYDLNKINPKIDKTSKTVTINNLPEPELTINPTIEYYDIKQDYFNSFEAKDYNKIQARVRENLEKKIKNSSLYSNAQNRLISELQKIYILTNSLGWTLVFEDQKIQNFNALETIKM